MLGAPSPGNVEGIEKSRGLIELSEPVLLVEMDMLGREDEEPEKLSGGVGGRA